jgi:menaquinone-9 beta-reductase
MPVTADALVIGGGPAGAAAAARMARGGSRIVLLERQHEPGRQVCGEFVSATATAELAALDVDLTRLGARPLTRARIWARSSEVATRLPFTGHGLSRARLDRILLATAARCGADVRTGIRVRTIERRHGTWSAALGDGSQVDGRALILATGKHDLRGHLRAARVPPMVGFKMHWRLRPDQTAALADAVELFVYEGGYAGLQPIENGIANLCLVMRADYVRGDGRAWPNALSHLRDAAPLVALRLRDAHPLWDRPVSVARIPYGYICPMEGAADALYPVGDQAAVIPSLAGEGIAIALRSGRRAAEAVLAGHSSERYATAVRREMLGPLRRAGMIDSLLRNRAFRGISLRLAVVPGVVPALAQLTRLRSLPASESAPHLGDAQNLGGG